MSPEMFLGWSIIGLMGATFAATASHIFHKFSRHELEEYCRRHDKLYIYDEIIESREQLALGADTLRIVSLCVAIICGIFFLLHGSIVDELKPSHVIGIVGAFALITLATNSWIPWAILKVAATPFLFSTWRFWWLVTLIASPLTLGFNILTALIQRAAGQSADEEDEEDAFEDEIRSMVSGGERDGLLDLDAREMIEGVIELDDKDVAEVMTPKKSIIALDVETDWEKTVNFASEQRKTRLPVYEGELNSIVGFLHTKDLLPELLKPAEQRRSLRELMRESMFVPESMPVDELLQQFQDQRYHLAIALDEYGAVSGLITIEDILEEIVGEIVDETEPEPDPTFRQIDSHTILTDGSTKLEKLNDELGWQLPEDLEVDTVAGLMMRELKEIPQNHSTMIFGNMEFKAVGHHPRLVEQVIVRRLNNEQLNNEEQNRDDSV